MVDYSKLSDNDLKALYNNDYSKISDEGIKLLYNDSSQDTPQKLSFGETLKASSEQLNEDFKLRNKEKLRKRQEWEQEHPVISNIQKTYQPGYRSSLIEMQNNAQYGLNKPLGVGLRELFQKAGQELVPATNLAVAIETGGLGTPATLGKKSLVSGGIGAIQGGVEALTNDIADNGLGLHNLSAMSEGAKIGGLTGLALPGGTNTVGKVTKTTLGAVKNVPRAIRETFAGVSNEAFDRIKSSPRGAELSSNSDYFGSNEFLNDIATRFQEGINNFKNQEIKAFAQARDNLIAQGKNTIVNTGDAILNVYNELKNVGLLDKNGNITRAGEKATGLRTFLDDIGAYTGDIDITDLQKFKTYILDEIINYKAPMGQDLGNSTRDLQKIAKDLRAGINESLGNILGDEYKAINSRLHSVLDIYDNHNIKDILNTNNIDTLAGKLKRLGSTRTQAAKDLELLENLMKESGINISDYSLIDDILDYQAAKAIQQRVTTGLGTVANIGRRAAFQPALENIILPFQKSGFNQGLKYFNGYVGRKLKGAKPIKLKPQYLTPLAEPVGKILYGGISNNEEYYE